MLIADHARKDVPEGSYSWKFIKDSIENGIIQLKDRYYIGHGQPAGSGSSKRWKRTEFTDADDTFLARWVLSFSHNRTGTAIYVELQRKVCRGPGRVRPRPLTPSRTPGTLGSRGETDT